MNNGIPWLGDVAVPGFQKIDKNYSVDVVVVGGGIAGIVTTYLLAREGLRVILCEKDTLISGETGFTTGFITQVFDTTLVEISDIWGNKIAKAVWDSGKDIITTIEEIILKENIECEFMRCPAYIFANDNQGFTTLKKEFDIAHSLGFSEVNLNNDSTLPFPNSGFLCVNNQAKWHVGKFLAGLLQKAKEYGALIFEHTTIDTVSDKEPVIIRSGDLEIKANFAVVDTNNPFTFVPEVQERVVPNISYVALYEIDDIVLTEGIYWDTEDPYHYFRIDIKDNKKTLMLGGEDHKTGDTPGYDPYDALEKYFNNKFPDKEHRLIKKWSGEVLESIDGLPYIGRTIFNKHILVSSGFAGNGMTFGPISAVINRDIILGKENTLIDVYKLARLKETTELIKHGFTVAKDTVINYVGTFKNNSIHDVEKGEGRIIKENGHSIAVYKKTDGSLCKLSPYCTHQKCIVAWNTNEKTWDCPCHGSRFTKDGKVITGPATEDLPVFKDKHDS